MPPKDSTLPLHQLGPMLRRTQPRDSAASPSPHSSRAGVINILPWIAGLVAMFVLVGAVLDNTVSDKDKALVRSSPSFTFPDVAQIVDVLMAQDEVQYDDDYESVEEASSGEGHEVVWSAANEASPSSSDYEDDLIVTE